ncbi:MAG: hypothetical protein VW576_02780 [Opitutae bacterium]
MSKTGLPPRPLCQSKQINEEFPLALGTSRGSFLEIELRNGANIARIRIGSETGLEFQEPDHYLLHKGSLLVSHREKMVWNLGRSDHPIQVTGAGTWMMECLTSGIKVILLEGKVWIGNSAETQMLSSGDLVLLDSTNPKGSKPIKVDLPLLLGTSRLINGFPAKLPSNSRLFSAAQVQALKLKKKYDALVGDVTEEKKLQLWTVPKK